MGALPYTMTELLHCTQCAHTFLPHLMGEERTCRLQLLPCASCHCLRIFPQPCCPQCSYQPENAISFCSACSGSSCEHPHKQNRDKQLFQAFHEFNSLQIPVRDDEDEEMEEADCSHYDVPLCSLDSNSSSPSAAMGARFEPNIPGGWFSGCLVRAVCDSLR